jgi:RHS repeat-associated protein
MSRMIYIKRLSVGVFCGLIFAALYSFFEISDVWSQCTPGERFKPAGSTSTSGPWMGDWVPTSSTPSNRPGNHTHYAENVRYSGYAICGYSYVPGAINCAFTGEMWPAWCRDYFCHGGEDVYSWLDTSQAAACGGDYEGMIYYICYSWNDTESLNNHDYDCDGLKDIADNLPTEPQNQGKNAGVPKDGVCPFVKNPINAATGNKYEEVLDISVSGPGVPLEFRRSYNSQLSVDGPLSYGWTHNFNVSLQEIPDTSPQRVLIKDSDGRSLYFNADSGTSEILFVGESGALDRLKKVVSTSKYYLRRKDTNRIYEFEYVSGSNWRLAKISDLNGNELTFDYGTANQLTITNNFGKSLVIVYDTGRITSVTDPKGQSVTFEYQNGDLTKVNYRDSVPQVKDFIEYIYDTHDLTEKKDTNGVSYGHWTYDWHRVTEYYCYYDGTFPEGKRYREKTAFSYPVGKTEVTRTTELGDKLTTYTTDVIDEIVVITKVEGCSSCGGGVKKEYAYVPGRLEIEEVTSFDDSVGYITKYDYHDPPYSWQIYHMTEAFGKDEERTTTYEYTYDQNNPLLVTQKVETKVSVVDSGNNRISTSNYDDKGNLTSRVEAGYVLIDVNGTMTPTQRTYTTSYQYNSYGQLRQIDGPRSSNSTIFEYYESTDSIINNRYQVKIIKNTVNGVQLKTELSNYDANGNVGKIKDPNNVETEYTYDERNRIISIKNLTANALTQYAYDARGNLSSIALPEGNEIDFTYNLANKLTEIKDSLNNKIQYQYDVEGNRSREEIKDSQNTLKKSLDFAYDAYNRLIQIKNPDLGQTFTEYTYDGRGNVIYMKDPNTTTGTTFSYAYDALSRLTQVTNQALSITTNQGYDTQDNPASVTDPRSHTTQYQYDDFGRKNQTTSPDTGVTKYEYDEAGNLTKRVDANGITVNYTYDALNRLTNIDFTGTAEDVAFTYDSTSVTYGIGRLTGRTDPSGSYTFHYHPDGRLKKEIKTIDTIQYTTEYEYNKNGVITKITYPTGKIINYDPDSVDKTTITQVRMDDNPNAFLASEISYLPFGGVTELTYGNDLILTQGYDTETNKQYWIKSITVGSVLNLTYNYDANGNVTSMDDNEAAGNEALETAGIYIYDQDSNLLAEIWGPLSVAYTYDDNANTIAANNRTFVYDSSNQLIQVLDNLNQIAAYTYNGAGQRIKKVTQSGTRIFHYDLKGHLIAETTTDGTMIAEYVYLGDRLLAMITKPGEMEIVSYFHNDHWGTPQVLTNDSQTVVWKAVYTPFGGADISVQTVENPFRLPGQYYDPETGLHYNYFRYYDPTTGRYVTPDPIGLDGGINLWPYVANNPLRWIDPRGLWTIGVGVTVNVQAGPINFNFSGGVVVDSSGNVGTYTTGGGGLGVGAEVSGGISVSGSNAQTINDLSGPFATGSLGGGWGPNASGDFFTGDSPHGWVYGGGVTVGAGLGAGGSSSITGTLINPLWSPSKPCKN